MTNPIYTQTDYKGYEDDAAIGSATQKADQNNDWTQTVDESFRIRFRITESNSKAESNPLMILQYRRYTGAGPWGSWTTLNTTSSVIKVVTSSYITDANASTRSLLGASVSADEEDDDGSIFEVADFVGNDSCETESAFQIVGADVVNGDLVEVRVSDPNLNSWTYTPQITVSKPVLIEIDVYDSVTVGEGTPDVDIIGATLEINVYDIVGGGGVAEQLGGASGLQMVTIPDGSILVTTEEEFDGAESLVFGLAPTGGIVDTATVYVAEVSGDLTIDVYDSVSVGESVTVSLPDALTINVNDSVSVSESVSSITETPKIDVSDSVNVVEVKSVEVSLLLVNINESATLTEQVTASLPEALAINVADSVNVSEYANADMPLEIDVYEEVTVSENVSSDVSDLFINVYDSVNAVDAATEYINVDINISDSVSVGESVDAEFGAVAINVYDSVNVAESSSLKISDLAIDVSDSVTVTDVPTVSVPGPAFLEINVSDSVTVSESVTADLTCWWDDDFTGDNGDPPNPDKWSSNDGGGSGEITVDIQSNQLRQKILDATSARTAVTDGYLKIPSGNFSVIVDWEKISAEEINYWSTGLWIYDPTTGYYWIIERHYRTGYGNNAYIAWAADPSWNEVNSPTSDTSGIFRMRRVGTTMYWDYWNGSSWSNLRSKACNTNAVRVYLRTESQTGLPDVDVRFDNFEVNVGCPPPTLLINVSDSITVTDVPTVDVEAGDVNPNVYDSVTVSDVPTVTLPDNLTINVSDSVNVGESVNGHVQLHISVSDSVNVAESITAVLPDALTIDISDSVTASDVPTVTLLGGTLDINVYDSVSLADVDTVSLPDSLKINVSDSVNVADSANISPPLISINVADSVSLTESETTAPLLLTLNVSEGVTLTELVGVAVNIGISVSDSVNLTDSPTVDVELPAALTINVSDSVTVSDQPSVYIIGANLNIDVNESVNVGESVTAIVQPVMNVSDPVNVTDSPAVEISPPAVNVSESITVGDTAIVDVLAPLALSINVSESVTITEQVGGIISTVILSVSDSITVVDEATIFWFLSEGLLKLTMVATPPDIEFEYMLQDIEFESEV